MIAEIEALVDLREGRRHRIPDRDACAHRGEDVAVGVHVHAALPEQLAAAARIRVRLLGAALDQRRERLRGAADHAHRPALEQRA